MLQLQIYLGVAASMTLLAAALMTERQAAQAASEEWRFRYEAAVLSSGNLLYDINLRNGKVVWGGNTRKVLGFFPQELSDTVAWLACVHPDDLGRLQSSGAQADSHVLEYRVRRKDGVWLDVEDTGEVVRLPDGRAVRAIGFLRDVSERKRAQAERDRLDAQLREAQKMEALGNMAGGIAHDFNNILGAILGYGEMAAERVPHDAKLRQQPVRSSMPDAAANRWSSKFSPSHAMSRAIAAPSLCCPSCARCVNSLRQHRATRFGAERQRTGAASRSSASSPCSACRACSCGWSRCR